MRSGLKLLVVATLAIASFLMVHDRVWEQRWETRQSAQASFHIPSSFSSILALEHRGLLSDYLFLKIMTFYGERVMFQEQFAPRDWDYIAQGLETVTDLDPYFLDPYVLAEGLLTWEAGRIEAANALLRKGWRHRPDDWQFPFFLGFNSFYFQGDNEKGAEYLMAAAGLPGSPNFLPTLAARIGYYGGKTKTAILFLKGLLAQTTDENFRKRLSQRLVALERAAFLENLVERFHQDHKHFPKKIEDLVTEGYFGTLPEEPYGGDWIILPKGRVFSTSKFVGSSH